MLHLEISFIYILYLTKYKIEIEINVIGYKQLDHHFDLKDLLLQWTHSIKKLKELKSY